MSRTRRPEKSLNHPSYEALIQGKLNEAHVNIEAITRLLDLQGEDRVSITGNHDMVLYVNNDWGVQKGGDAIRIANPKDLEVILGYFSAKPGDTEPEKAFRQLETKFLQAEVIQEFVEALVSALRSLQTSVTSELR